MMLIGGYRGMSGYWNEYSNILTVGTVHLLRDLTEKHPSHGH